MQEALPETPTIDEVQSPPTVPGDADTAPKGPTDSGAATAPVPPPEHIGKYEVVALLGRGGMGAVYRALDPVLEREVAVKVMLPQIAEDPEQKQRFEREARAIARLTHSNVVMVFDLGYHTDGAPYIVMELLRGDDLLHLMHQEPGLSLSQKISIVVQVLNGLGHAHKLGIVHRDIKPANVSITEDGSAKIMDFGIAHLASASATADGSVIGTAAYMSPEQARGGRVDGRSDLFSVGSLLCELVTGRRPFEAETIAATLYAIAQGQPQLRLPAGPEYERLRPVLEKALRKDREARFATSAEFAGALAACLDASGAVAAEPAAFSPKSADASPGGDGRPAPDAHPGGVPFAAPARPAVEAPPARPADPSKLFRLLREIYVGGKSGQLHFTAGRSCRGLRILKGQVIHGTSDVDGEHLGDVLVRYGVITESDREKAVEIVLRERRQLGEVLVGQGLLDQARLEEAIGLHVREILFAMLDGPDGVHSFEELSETAMGNGIACQLSTGEVILEATRRVQDPALVRQILGDTGRILALSSDPLLRSQKITLTPTDGFVMSRVDGTLSAREVLSLSPVPAADTERSLFGLLCTGAIDYQEKHTTGRSRTSPHRTGRGGQVSTARTRPATKPPSPASSLVSTTNPAAPAAGSGNGTQSALGQGTQDLRQLILEAHGRLNRDHFEVLGLPRSATDTDVRQVYSRIARLLHPDAPRPAALAGEEAMREEVFLRVTAAYETLRDPELRRQYELAYEPSKLSGPVTPLFTPTSEPEPEPTPPPPPAPKPAPPPAAEAKPAPPPVPEAEPAAASVDPKPAPAPPPETEPTGFDPAAALEKAEAQFAEAAYWDVIQRVEPLLPQIRGPLRTRGLLLLARAYMKNPHWQRRAEAALLRLLEDDPECTPAHLFLGQIYAGQDLTSRARSMYRRVLELEPENQAALRELSRLDPPAEEPEDSALRTWFKGRGPAGA